MISYCPLGGGREIGKSCYVYTFDIPVMVDSGMKPFGSGVYLTPENIESAIPRFNRVPYIKYILITHGHYDHSGALMYAHRHYKDAVIVMTAPTKAFCRMHLLDMARKMERSLAWKESKWFFTTEDVETLMEKVIIIDKADGKTPIRLSGDLYVLPDGAGHMLGACSFFFVYKDQVVYHSGDISWEDQYFTKGASLVIPELVRTLRMLFANVEGTYANHEHKQENEDIIDAIEGVVRQGGKSLVATLGINRAQELWMHCYRNRHRIPMERVFVDGSAERYFDIFEKFVPEARMLRFAQSVPKGWKGRGWQKAFERDKLAKSNEPLIIIASGAMLQEKSAAYNWADLLISGKKNAVFLTSFLEKCSVGHELLESVDDSERMLKLFDGRGVGGAQVKRFNLSAHTDKKGTTALLNLLRPKIIGFHHGEPNEVKPFIAGSRKGSFVYPKTGQEVKL